MELLSGIREFARVLVLLCQHARSDERAALARAAFYASPDIFWKDASSSKWGRHFPALMLALPSLLCEDTRPTYQGVELSFVGFAARSSQMCLRAHCTCSSLFGPGESGTPSFTHQWWHPPCFQRAHWVRIPCWVVNAPASTVRPHGDRTRYRPAPLRFHYRDQNAPPPLGLDQGVGFVLESCNPAEAV